MAGKKVPIEKRFWDKVNKTETCWLWTAALSHDGYGLSNKNGRNVYAHRVAHELIVGPIPEDREIDHLCRVRNCVNPEHLEIVTKGENLRRGWEARRALVIECRRGHPFNDENTYLPPRGGRECRTCRREVLRRFRAGKP